MAKSPQKSEAPGKARRGRPDFRPTVEQRIVVEQMVFCGESQVVIARAIGIKDDTLRKHFADELENGHANRRKEVIGLLFREAQAGNVSAIKRLDEIGRDAGAAEAVERRAAPAPKLGKKQEQQQAAERVSGKFSPPAPPKLVVHNR
ncbi:hypothetical protein [Methylobacterium segetis]|uniref:hypothetical protein n=1 Tax=Methylobacterium segetis TaxID=2488750 RepID=UPI00104891AC|nr:hypothetical protein [Methylobacterium segetis]